MDLKTLNLEQLKDLKDKVQVEISKREGKDAIKYIYTHDCYDRSTYHQGKYKHYVKTIRSIDDTKSNGYAFIGDFLKVDKENLVVADSYVVECCSGTLKLYLIIGNQEKELVLEGTQRTICAFIQEAKRITRL